MGAEKEAMRTQVLIIGGGPSGALLSHILSVHGIENVVLERQTKAYVLARIRAGVLEPGTVDLLREYGLATRLDREGHVHNGIRIEWPGYASFVIDGARFTGRKLVAYGQNYITEDLYAALDAAGHGIVEQAESVSLHNLSSGKPSVTYEKEGRLYRIDCDFIAGCDGFHGVSRRAVRASDLKTFEKVYPFGWLGILSETPPLSDIIYAYHERGFALASQRGPTLSRYYIQCPASDRPEDWPDDRFWAELKARFPQSIAAQIKIGHAVEKSIAPLRSFVCEPMQYGPLYLVGDAAHIVPPTGAKGLNLAISDVYYLSRALCSYYASNSSSLLSEYSATALKRVWGAVRLSWWLTTLLHVFPNEDSFQSKIRNSEYDYLTRSERAQAALAEQFVGLPL
jgi:p-hydroxybenzoate 3-monooxygenase